VYFSDRFHNSDVGAARLSKEARFGREVFWLRMDFLGISLVLSSMFALWSCHFGWPPLFQSLTWSSFGATLVVGVAAFALFERKGDAGLSSSPIRAEFATSTGEVVIKAMLGLQFVGIFGYLVYQALQTSCAPHTAIWFMYLPGFVAYTLGIPANNPRWGAHDVFHVFVLLGHILSASLDALNVRWDCIAEEHP
jgi:hypothetical protein